MLELSTLLALTATFLRERKTAASEATADEFRQWLQEEAVPRILGSSDDVLEMVQEAAASQHEKLDAILGRIESLGRELGLQGPEDTWSAPSEGEHRLLRHLYDQVLSEPDAGSDIGKIAEEFETDAESLSRSARRLAERSLARTSESTGGTWIRISRAGILLAWRFDDRRDALAEASRLNEMILGLSRPDSLRVQEILDETGLPSAIVNAYCEALSERGYVRYRTGYGAIESNLLGAPSESFLEGPPSLDRILVVNKID